VINQHRISRFLRFCAVGISVAAVDFGLVWILSPRLRPLIAVSIAYLTAVCCHFLLNKMWVFRCSRTDYAKQLAQYALAVTGCWLTTVGVVQLSLSTITSNILLAKLIAVPPATIVGFVLLQLFVFASRKKSTISIPDLPV
jgi:putative flippase GtrA